MSAIEPGPGRPSPESGGIPDQPSFVDNLDTGSGKSFPRYGGALWVQDLFGDSEDYPEALLHESGAMLHVLNYTGGMDPGAGVPWPESACQSDMSDIVSAFDPGPDRPFPRPEFRE